MSHSSILEYLAEISKTYFKTSKLRKSDLLGHAVQITGLHRKSIIRHLAEDPRKTAERADPELKRPILKNSSCIISPFSGNPWTEYPPDG